jgi:RNAse (barnase) inhibitor barstar
VKNTHFLIMAPGIDPATSFLGWRLARINGSEAKTLKGFYNQMAEALDFPDYFGHNLDSLDELLNDLQWIKENRIIIYIKDSAAWLSAEKSGDKLTTVLDLMEATAEDWKWLDEDDELNKKELRILFEDSPRIRKWLEEQEIPYGMVD